MKKLLAIVLSISLFASCSSNKDFEKGKRILEQQGYTNIKNTGYNWGCCDEKDNFSTGFEAAARDGTKIEGCFCSTLLKGVTIRFD